MTFLLVGYTNIFTIAKYKIIYEVRDILGSNAFLRNVCELANYAALPLSVRVRVTLRLTVSQSVCLGVEPRPGLMTRY
jgi:hypothetical protein